MNKITSILTITALTLAALPGLAQERRLSPHETISANFGGDRITVTYGRPYTIKPGTTEVRKIWGGLVPYGEPWRMGADEATTLIIQKPIELGGSNIPAGAYTLYMIPQENGPSQLAISTHIGGWGIPVDTADDLARVDMTRTALDKLVDQFTMAIAKTSSESGEIKAMWESTQFSVPFTIQK
ncbi:MAG TPA: DUF2911 domain-containing protein [Verrucomicrobiae bacterium]|nr:DUF2911 domain-containing protein [Verrucomicrobiae bacterium]